MILFEFTLHSMSKALILMLKAQNKQEKESYYVVFKDLGVPLIYKTNISLPRNICFVNEGRAITTHSFSLEQRERKRSSNTPFYP